MNNGIIEIPFSSFVAYMLLNDREVSFFEISKFISKCTTSSIEDFDVIEDDDSSFYDYVDIDNANNNEPKFVVNNKIDYDKTIVNGVTFRKYLEGVASCITKVSFKVNNDNVLDNNSVNSKKLIFRNGKK